MNDFNTAEYVVTQAKEGKNLAKRRLLMLSYVLGLAAVIGLIALSGLWVVVSVIPILLWIVVHFTWRTVNVEYKYTIAHGIIEFSECYSSGNDKVTVSLPVKDFSYIGSLTEGEQKTNGFASVKVYDYRGSKEKTPVAVGLFEQNGKKCAVLFIYDKKCASLLKLYNKNTEL